MENSKCNKVMVCPFDSTHLVKEDELQAHVLSCKSNDKNRFKMLVQSVGKTPLRPILEESEEQGNEPPIPVYNPDIHFKNSFIVRNVQGKSAVVRRKFMETERLRFEAMAFNNKLDPPKDSKLGN